MTNSLSSSQRENLTNLHRKEKNRRNADRIKAILLSDKGWSYRKIAEALLLDEQTISLHVSDYKSKAKVSLSSGGSQSKLNSLQTTELIAHLEQNPYDKVIDIATYVKSNYGVCYSKSGMTAWLYQNNFSYKKPQATPAKADPIKQDVFVNEYEQLKKDTPDNEPILFGDGVHPTMATKITHGWIRKGKKRVISTIASRTRVNLMGAINLKNMQVDIEKYETINSDSMLNFLTLIKSKYPEAPQIHLILDRGPYNISRATAEYAAERKIKIHHLPAYSPNLNPIERLWKVMNERVRNNTVFESAKEFRHCIMNFFRETWPTISDSMRSRINDNFQRLENSMV